MNPPCWLLPTPVRDFFLWSLLSFTPAKEHYRILPSPQLAGIQLADLIAEASGGAGATVAPPDGQ